MPQITRTIETKPDGTKITTIRKGESKMNEAQTTIAVAQQEVVQPLPDAAMIMTLGAIVAVLVWGVIEIVKTFFKGWKEQHNGSTPWYWSASLRLAAMVLGAAAGTSLYDAVIGGSGWPWGAAIGAGGGALCTIIVGVVKKVIRAKAE